LGALQALFFACQNMSDEASLSSSEQKECKLYNEHVDDLQQLAGKFSLNQLIEQGQTWTLLYHAFNFGFSINIKLKVHTVSTPEAKAKICSCQFTIVNFRDLC
jgi:hypothetical protein